MMHQSDARDDAMSRARGKTTQIITLRSLPPHLVRAIRQRARERGLSLNKTVISMLEESLAGPERKSRRPYHDLDHLFGTWTPEEADAFEADLKEQRRIDPDLWQ
jgi:hypothetical protein